MLKHAIKSVTADHRFQFLGVAIVIEAIIIAEICVTRIISDFDAKGENSANQKRKIRN